jgi:hypothetical protein
MSNNDKMREALESCVYVLEIYADSRAKDSFVDQVIESAKAALSHKVEQEPMYACHNCKQVVPPPDPFMSYVYCSSCNVNTAATIAADLARVKPATIPEPTIDDAIAVQNAIGDGPYGGDDIEMELEALRRAYHIILKKKLSAAPSIAEKPDVDELAQFIRSIDGNHDMGSGVLAERICEWLEVE